MANFTAANLKLKTKFLSVRKIIDYFIDKK